MANCNDNTCPPSPCTLNNAILNYKRAVGPNSPSLNSFLAIINQLQRQINCSTSGSEGTSGTNGSSGTSGFNGNDGTAGTSGKDGSGTSGSSGKDGSGTSGSSGISGIDGSSGSSGSAGTDGSSGSSGLSGDPGTSGQSGTAGSSGTSGLPGTSGSTGTSGTSPAYAKTFDECFDMNQLVVGEEFPLLISDMSYTIGQPIIIAYSPEIYFTGIVLFYTPRDAFEGTTSGLLILRLTSVKSEINDNGDEIYCRWTINIGGGLGSNLLTGSTYPITASWAITASYALNANAGTSLRTGSTYPITSSWALTSSYGGYYTNFNYVPKTLGGVIAGTSFNNIPIQDVLTNLLYPYQHPSASLTSSTKIEFNQTVINNKLTMSYVINSQTALVDSVSLEWRRNNVGSWTVLSTSTTTPYYFTHSLTDTNFNTDSFNYKYTVFDTEGGSDTALWDITPKPYVEPYSSLTVLGANISSPETDLKRNVGNVSTNLTGSIIQSSSYVNLVSYSVQYLINGVGNWVDVPGLSNVPIVGSNVNVPFTNHNPVAYDDASSIIYRLKVTDDFVYTSTIPQEIEFLNLIYYGTSSTAPSNSNQVKSLTNKIFIDGINPHFLYTGTTYKNFTSAMPSSISIKEALDLDASYTNITSNYSSSLIFVNDGNNNPLSYSVYIMTNGIPYNDRTHKHRITRSTGYLIYYPSINTLNWSEEEDFGGI